MAVWQIAAGSLGRDYSDRFLRHGLAFVGGEWQCRAMEEVRPGDTIILKQGMHLIVAVGVVVERDGRSRGWNDKEWLTDFDGWDLAAWCNVDWSVPDKPIDTHGLTRATIQRVGQAHLLELAGKIVSEIPSRAVYEPEPAATNPVTDQYLIGHLVEF